MTGETHAAYHWTSDSAWRRIEQASSNPSGRLVPSKELDLGRLGMRLPDFAHEKYLFAFLDESIPGSWEENPDFPDLWKRVMNHVCKGDSVAKLFRFDILPGDKAYVLDFAHLERVKDLLWATHCLHSADDHDVIKVMDATERYIHSRVPLADYNGSFCLPELILSNPVSIDRLTEVNWPYI